MLLEIILHMNSEKMLKQRRNSIKVFAWYFKLAFLTSFPPFFGCFFQAHRLQNCEMLQMWFQFCQLGAVVGSKTEFQMEVWRKAVGSETPVLLVQHSRQSKALETIIWEVVTCLLTWNIFILKAGVISNAPSRVRARANHLLRRSVLQCYPRSQSWSHSFSSPVRNLESALKYLVLCT